MARWAGYVAVAAAVAPLISIAAANILIGASLLLVLIAVRPLRYPPIVWPLLAFLGWTLLSWAASGHMQEGLPQIKKFWVWLLPLALYSAVTTLRAVRWIVMGWALAAGFSSLWSVGQFVAKYRWSLEHGNNFYRDYVAHRTTGMMSHWMTFSGEQMVVTAMLGAMVLFSQGPWRKWLMGALAVLLVAILLNETRSVWMAVIVVSIYLVGRWRPKLLPVLPVLLLAAYFLGPQGVRQRVDSIIHPDPSLDSNAHRVATFRAGVEMIKAHPWLGLGPEEPGKQFDQYLPADVPKPEGFYGHLHNIYVQFAAERGIPALLALLMLIGTALWDFWGAAQQAPDGLVKALLEGSMAAMIGILVAGFFEHNLGDSEVLMLFLVTLCVGYVAARPHTETAPIVELN